MKRRALKEIKQSLGRILLLLLLLLAAVAWRGQLLGFRIDGTSHENYELELNLSQCVDFFEDAKQIKKISASQLQILGENNQILGYAFGYKGEKGYGGRVPIFILTDGLNVVRGVQLGNHYESDEYLTDILKSGLLNSWNGLAREETASQQVDVVSGATISSQAIILGVKIAATGEKIKADYQSLSFKNIFSSALLLVLTLAFFNPKYFAKYRKALLIVTVIVFGFWLTFFLSFGQIMGWLAVGINWKVQIVLAVLFILSVMLPLLFGKSFYCNWVCPFGAAQELCGSIGLRKIRFEPRVTIILRSLRQIIFLGIMVFLWLGFIFDLSKIEPFSAFSIYQSSYISIGIAGLFLLISFFVPKAWCKYFCPTGYLLDWINNKSD